MFPVWTSVKVINEQHARFGAAGAVFATNPDHPDEVTVKFDLDEQREAVAVADLKALN